MEKNFYWNENFEFYWDQNEFKLPYFITAIAGVQIIVFLLQLIAYYGSYSRLGSVLDCFVSNSKKVREGQLWRLFTHTFLHGNWLHLLFNILGEVWAGGALEAAFGSLFIAALYFTSAIGGDLLSGFARVLMKSESIGIGASGAVFGIQGVWIVFRCVNYSFDAGVLLMVFIGALNLVTGLCSDGRTDHWAHLGGLITGLLICCLWECMPEINSATNMNLSIWEIIFAIYHVTISAGFFLIPFARKAGVAKRDVEAMIQLGIPRSHAERLLREHGDVRSAADAYYC